MDSQLIAEKAEAVNRLTRAVHDALPYWIDKYNNEWDGVTDHPDEVEYIVSKMLTKDMEVRSDVRNLLRIIIEEKTLLDQK